MRSQFCCFSHNASTLVIWQSTVHIARRRHRISSRRGDARKNATAVKLNVARRRKRGGGREQQASCQGGRVEYEVGRFASIGVREVA